MTSGTENLLEEGDRQISMPAELMQFIQRDTYSLLIKGYAGTGKTTLALTILRALGSRNNFFYISTRISPKELFSYYPWLSDLSQVRQSDTEEERDNLPSLPSFEDARLDEPESLFERITNQLMDIKSPIIVIDSWDAIASFMDKEGRLNNERVLQTWRERAGAKLIFISEHPDDSTLDFLVGGVVELKQKQYDNSRFREITLHKLRGVRIGRPSYIYTLENSLFRSFEPYIPPNSSQPRKERPNAAEPAAMLSGDRITSGYLALDRALGGGFPRRGIVLLSRDGEMSVNVAMSVLADIASCFIYSGNLVIVQPGQKIEPSEVMTNLSHGLPSGTSDSLKILWPKRYPGLAANVIVQSSKTNLSRIVSRLRKKRSGSLVLNLILGDLSFAEKGDVLGRATKERLADSCDVSIALANTSNKEDFEYLAGITDVHIRLVMIKDTLFLQPVLPASTLLAVEYDNGRISLEAVV